MYNSFSFLSLSCICFKAASVARSCCFLKQRRIGITGDSSEAGTSGGPLTSCGLCGNGTASASASLSVGSYWGGYTSESLEPDEPL